MNEADWFRSRQSYRVLMERLYGFHASIEPGLLTGSRTLRGLEWSHWRQVPFLVEDLARMGHDDASMRRLDRPGDGLLLDDPARALGAIYVLEGATLGGKVLERAARRRLGSENIGTSFFGAYGTDAGRRWVTTRSAIDQAAEAFDAATVLHAASDTFDSFGEWMVP